MTRRPAVFFDRDNTLIISDGYLGDPEKVRLIEGAAEAVARSRRLGFAVVTVSNQSGVARGLFTEETVRAVNRRMDDLMKSQIPTAVVDLHEFCPFHPDASVEQYRRESELRKPQPGMFLRAAQNFQLELTRSWMIGDAPRDIAAGKAAGCRTIHLRMASLTQSPAVEEPMTVAPDYTVGSLKEALDVIEQNSSASSSTPHSTPHSTPPGTPRATSSAVATAPTVRPSIRPTISTPTPALSTTPAMTEHSPGAAPTTADHNVGTVAVTKPSNEPAPTPTTVSGGSSATVGGPEIARLERALDQILHELKQSRQQPPTDFSLSRLLAGITQILTLAALLYAYFNLKDNAAVTFLLLTAMVLQTMTVALLLMGRQK